MRAVSELITLLVLIGAVTIASLITLVVVPRYFETYNSVAVEASYHQDLPGYRTDAALIRVYKDNGYSLIILIHNNDDKEIKVNYYVYCESSGKSKLVLRKEGVSIHPRGLYVEGCHLGNEIAGKTCYLVVEEPNLLIYKVLES